MIVTTINVNGVRAAVRQRSEHNLGLLHWLSNCRSDVVCLQETRADDAQLAEALAPALSGAGTLPLPSRTSRGAAVSPSSAVRRSRMSGSV